MAVCRRARETRMDCSDARAPREATHRLVPGWSRLALSVFVGAATLVGAGCSRKGGSSTAGLRLWYWMTDREDAFNELAKRYKQEHGVDVRCELYAPSDLYSQKVRAAAQTDGLPDIYGVLGELRDVASFVKAGHVLSLTDALEANNKEWEKVFFPVALEMNRFKPGNNYAAPPGTYGVPIDVMNIQVFYNKKLLKELGLDPEHPPQTWDAFLDAGKRAKAKGMTGFVSGWAELWMVDCFATNYAVHLMGMEKVAATFRGERRYTEPEWIAVLHLFEQMRDSGLLADGIVTMGNKQAEQLFANEQAVFAFNGTWGVNVFQSMNPNLDYGVMMLPVVDKSRPMVTWGGAGSSFMVNAKSQKAAQAVDFLKWLTAEPQQRYLLEQTNNIPANQLAATNLPPKLAAFADAMKSVIHPRLFDVQERSVVIEGFDKGIQSILIGEQTPLQVAQAVQQVKQREEARQASLQSDHATR